MIAKLSWNKINKLNLSWIRIADTDEYSSLTFMHIKDKQKAINKVHQLLKNGGLFVISTDKNQSDFIDIGSNKIEVFPDTPEEIINCINNSGLNLLEHYETEFANVFVCRK